MVSRFLWCLIGLGVCTAGNNGSKGNSNEAAGGSNSGDPTGNSAIGQVAIPTGGITRSDSKYDKFGGTMPMAAHQIPAFGNNYYNSYNLPLESTFGQGVNTRYGSNPYGPPGNNYPHHNGYYPEIYERAGKEFSSRASGISNTNHVYDLASSGQEYGNLALATGHHHAHHGWGWGKGGHFSKISDSAIGLLGLIGLFSLLQNVLLHLTTTASTTAANTGRKKRDAVDSGSLMEDSDAGEANRLSMLIFPALNVIGHARQGGIPLECTHREVCIANGILTKELGVHGRSVGSMMSTAIIKLLKETDRSGAIEKHVREAGLNGRNGKDCHETYPVCTALEALGTRSLPPLMEPQKLLAKANA